MRGWLSPDPADGSPANPQSWNRYPYVLNDPLTLVDPLGGTPRSNPYLVGCFPSVSLDVLRSVFAVQYGCNWEEDPEYGECPPGYDPVYGTPSGKGGPAIANAQSLAQLARYRLNSYAGDNGLLSWELGLDGAVHLGFPNIEGGWDLGSLSEIQDFGDFLDLAVNRIAGAIGIGAAGVAIGTGIGIGAAVLAGVALVVVAEYLRHNLCYHDKEGDVEIPRGDGKFEGICTYTCLDGSREITDRPTDGICERVILKTPGGHVPVYR
ncbi:MAG: hypothetical protein HY651_07830 [Acidobacteria bacterium]|nr:hypothetical protein [Acidobacteriota bacterium]